MEIKLRVPDVPHWLKLVLCAVAIAAVMGSGTWFAWHQFDVKDQRIAELESKLAVWEMPIGPGSAHLHPENIIASGNGTVIIRYDNAWLMTVEDSGPMLPLLGQGTVVVMEQTADVTPGDVVIAGDGESYAVTRIIGESEGGWIVKADKSYEASLIKKESVRYRLWAPQY